MYRLVPICVTGATLSLIALAIGCGGGGSSSLDPGADPSDPQASAPTGKADNADPAAPLEFTFLQAGFFEEAPTTPSNVPVLLHFGYVTEPGPDWQDVQDLPVEYENGRNKEIKISVPDAHRDHYFAYVFQYQPKRHSMNLNPPGWTQDKFVDLQRPDGRFILVPATDGAGYPFSSECYTIHVMNEAKALGDRITDGVWSDYPGKLSRIFYGFTQSSLDQYRASNDVPWENFRGDLVAEGVVGVDHQHDGGYKGAYHAVPTWVRVPAGRNLAFKLEISKYSGSCYSDNDTVDLGKAETQTYFTAIE